MDIVHLIDTRTSQEETSHTYAEIEWTIAQDHSEGTQASCNLRQTDDLAVAEILQCVLLDYRSSTALPFYILPVLSDVLGLGLHRPI